MKLNPAQRDRAAGVLLGCAVGDALGVPYEFQPPQEFTAGDLPLGMPGGGPFKFGPGEWSDDTAMSVCIAGAAWDGLDLSTTTGLDHVARAFLGWRKSGPKDMGGQVSSVLGSAAHARGQVSAVMARIAADRVRRLPTQSAGNGSLMRTSPVALRHLANPRTMTAAARSVSALTHADPDCLDACTLWVHAIRGAVLSADPVAGIAEGLAALEPGARKRWAGLLETAEQRWPWEFEQNGWVVHALQAAWSAVTLGLEEGGYENGITAAVGCGRDTDTVAAIAGAVLGARFGSSGIRAEWRNEVHGWPSLKGADLIRAGVEITAKA